MSAGIIRVGLTAEERRELMKIRLWAAYQFDWYYCPRCKEWGHESKFCKSSTGNFTISRLCRSCHRKQMIEYHKKKQNGKARPIKRVA